jgi:hypothetical protein
MILSLKVIESTQNFLSGPPRPSNKPWDLIACETKFGMVYFFMEQK